MLGRRLFGGEGGLVFFGGGGDGGGGGDERMYLQEEGILGGVGWVGRLWGGWSGLRRLWRWTLVSSFRIGRGRRDYRNLRRGGGGFEVPLG